MTATGHGNKEVRCHDAISRPYQEVFVHGRKAAICKYVPMPLDSKKAVVSTDTTAWRICREAIRELLLPLKRCQY